MFTRSYLNAKLSSAFTGEQAKVIADLFEVVGTGVTDVNDALSTVATKLNADALADSDYAAATLVEKTL